MNYNHKWKIQLRICLILLIALCTTVNANSESIVIQKDIVYKSGNSLTEYEKQRCKLDLYLPQNNKDFPVIVWFHGGSLKQGDKSGGMTISISKHFAMQGIAVAVVNYRLSPKVTYPAYIQDAAASVSWVIKNIEHYKGNPKKVFVSGHSAGGYLAAMLGVNSKYLEENEIQIKNVAGYIPVSGQMITHSTVREEQGISKTRPLIDEAAPSYHVQKDVSPFLSICGSDDLPGRAEENMYFVAAMKASGNETVKYLEFKDRNHGTIVSKISESEDPVATAIINFIETISMK